MSSREWWLRVQDILIAIDNIQRYINQMSFDTFEADEMTSQAVSYNFIVIGEAANNIPVDLQSRYPEIDWRNVCGMRNVIAHEYFQLELETLWDTLQNDLPILKRQLQELLQREDRR